MQMLIPLLLKLLCCLVLHDRSHEGRSIPQKPLGIFCKITVNTGHSAASCDSAIWVDNLHTHQPFADLCAYFFPSKRYYKECTKNDCSLHINELKFQCSVHEYNNHAVIKWWIGGFKWFTPTMLRRERCGAWKTWMHEIFTLYIFRVLWWCIQHTYETGWDDEYLFFSYFSSRRVAHVHIFVWHGKRKNEKNRYRSVCDVWGFNCATTPLLLSSAIWIKSTNNNYIQPKIGSRVHASATCVRIVSRICRAHSKTEPFENHIFFPPWQWNFRYAHRLLYGCFLLFI